MNKIIIHSIAFCPDGVSTAYLYNDIALKFKDNGYEVVVLTTTPHYNVLTEELKKHPLNRRLWGLYYESDYQGITVKHVPQKKFKRTLLRIVGFVYWHLVTLILGLFEKNVDVILSPSPPLTLGFINIILGKLKRCKVIYNVQEIYPDLLIESGGLKSKGIISLFKKLEKFVYNHSDAVTTIDRVFYDTIVNRFENKSKLSIISNFVDTSIYKPLSRESVKISSPYFPNTDALKLMYAGNIGHAQDWETFVDLAIKLKEEKIEFFIIGEGVMRDYLNEKVGIHGLSNVHLIPYQPRELMPSLIAYSDIQFIFMSSKTDGQGFPSKVYTIMACAKPMLVCSGENTPIINFLKDKNCSYLIEEKNIDKKVDLLVKVLKSIDKQTIEDMGKRGMADISLNYSKEVVTTKYFNLVQSIV